MWIKDRGLTSSGMRRLLQLNNGKPPIPSHTQGLGVYDLLQAIGDPLPSAPPDLLPVPIVQSQQQKWHNPHPSKVSP